MLLLLYNKFQQSTRYIVNCVKFWTILNPLQNWNMIILKIFFCILQQIPHLKCNRFTVFEKITCGKFQLGMEHLSFFALIFLFMIRMLPTCFYIIELHVIALNRCFMVWVIQMKCKYSPFLLLYILYTTLSYMHPAYVLLSLISSYLILQSTLL